MLIEVAIKLLIPVAAGFFMGLYLDSLISTTPLIAIICSILGMFTGIYLVFRQYVK